MIKNDFFKVLLLLTILFFSISLVSAEGNFTTLQTEITNAQDNGKLVLNQSYKYDQTTDGYYREGITINKTNFVLDGGNYTIDGDGKARIFHITGNNVTIKNLNLINGKATEHGGAIYTTGQSINIHNSTFINNTATNSSNSYGGAI
ncbi:hypothetical protein LJB96_05535, partial [Methanobrevibacter sp. OttesenSCG-928-K11]|nr:hypothetical protein [Methanobrevibacter sp. OttesenSCG-928-K11]